jgi:hypothetical protein
VRLLEQTDRFSLVEKIGRAGEVAGALVEERESG